MSAPRRPMHYRIIGITWGNGDMRDAAESLGRSFNKLHSVTTYYDCVLPIDPGGSTHAVFSLQASLREVGKEIQSADEKIVIYYGGHALMDDKKWFWHSAPSKTWDGYNQLEPDVDISHFISTIRNDILLIFDCPLNIYRELSLVYDLATPSPNRNVQVISFAKKFSEEGRGQHGKTCLRAPKHVSDATDDLAKQLSQLSKMYFTVQDLVACMTDLSTAARPAPYHRPVLGLPTRFVLNLPPTPTSAGMRTAVPKTTSQGAEASTLKSQSASSRADQPTSSSQNTGGESQRPAVDGASNGTPTGAASTTNNPFSKLKKIFGPVQPDARPDPAPAKTQSESPAAADQNPEPEAEHGLDNKSNAPSETGSYATAVHDVVSRVSSLTTTESTQVQPSTMADERDLRETRYGTYVMPGRSVRSQAASIHSRTTGDPSVTSSVSGAVPVGNEGHRDDKDSLDPSSSEGEGEEVALEEEA